MKRFAALLLVCLFFLGGCGKSERSPETQNQTAPAEQTNESMVETAPVETEPTETQPEEPQEDAFVRVLDYLPEASQELLYATDRNFTGQVIYDFSDAYLRYGTVKKLLAVSEDLAQLGLSLKIWDGFRPVSFLLETIE